MSADVHRVVVGINDSPGAEDALQWAVGDARVRKVPVLLTYAYRWTYSYPRGPMFTDMQYADLLQSRNGAEQIVTRMVDRAYELAPGFDVDGAAIDGPAVQVLIDQSEYASVLVLGSRQLKALGSVMLGSVSAAVAARAACPTVVVRGPAGSAEQGAAVVVGVDGTQASEAVLQFGFDHASRHHLPLRAVLCWHPDLLAVVTWRPQPPAPERVEAWLSEALAGWREKYPDVDVHAEVIREHPADGLVLASRSQSLLVVGSRGRHALPGTLLGSVSQGVLHHATCPVAVVPTRGD